MTAYLKVVMRFGVYKECFKHHDWPLPITFFEKFKSDIKARYGIPGQHSCRFKLICWQSILAEYQMVRIQG